MTFRKKISDLDKFKIVLFGGLIFFTIYFMGPILWVLLTAVKSPSEVNIYPPQVFPNEWRWGNFIEAWQSQPFGVYFKNSMLITVFTTVGQAVSTSLTAYGFTRFEFKGKNILFFLLLASMMLPWDVTVIPQYMLFNELGWINTLKPLIVPGMFASAYNVFLLRQFLLNFPEAIVESARIDGANEWQIFTRIYLPLMKPPLFLISMLNIMTVWNDYLGPLIILQDRSKYTMALGLASFQGVHSTNIIGIMAITVIMMLVPVLAFLFAQKYIIDGLEGAVK